MVTLQPYRPVSESADDTGSAAEHSATYRWWVPVAICAFEVHTCTTSCCLRRPYPLHRTLPKLQGRQNRFDTSAASDIQPCRKAARLCRAARATSKPRADGSAGLKMADFVDYDVPRDYLAEEGFGKMEPVLLDKAEGDGNNDMIDSTAKEVGPGDIDPGCESLGFGQVRLGSEPPSALPQGSSETSPALLKRASKGTSRTATPCSDDDPGLSYSPGSSTMDESVVEEQQMSMACVDQVDILYGSRRSEHNKRQTEGPISEVQPVTPKGSVRTHPLARRIVSGYARQGIDGRSISRDRSPTIEASPTPARDMIVCRPVITRVQQRASKAPDSVRRLAPKAGGIGRKAKSAHKAFTCSEPGCEKLSFKSAFELKYVRQLCLQLIILLTFVQVPPESAQQHCLPLRKTRLQ